MRRIRREPISDVVTDQIRAAILDGTLAPGSRIRQEELAARLGVSRAPIRQALLVLEREALVQTKHSRGAVVAPLDPDFITNVYEFRGVIDAHVAATLAGRADFDPQPFRQIVAEGRAAVRAADLARLIELDLRFHSGLYAAAGNPVLAGVMLAQWSHIRRVMAATLTLSGYAAHVWDEHAAILDVISRRQVSRARNLALTHTTDARKRLIGSIGSGVSPAKDVTPSRLDAVRPRGIGAAASRRSGRRTRHAASSEPPR